MKTLIIKTIRRLEPTQNMIDAGITDARYQIGVHGNYPRTDVTGRQCQISIPVKTLAIHLQNIGLLKQCDMDEATYRLKEDPSWIQDFIGGKISGVEFQAKGSMYKLNEYSKDVKAGIAKIGEERETKNSNFIVDYDAMVMMRNPEMVLVDRIAEKRAKADEMMSGAFAGLLGGSSPVVESTDDSEVIATEETTVHPWGDTLESMIAYANEQGLRDSLGTVIKQDDTLKAGKSLENVSEALEALTE